MVVAVEDARQRGTPAQIEDLRVRAGQRDHVRTAGGNDASVLDRERFNPRSLGVQCVDAPVGENAIGGEVDELHGGCSLACRQSA